MKSIHLNVWLDYVFKQYSWNKRQPFSTKLEKKICNLLGFASICCLIDWNFAEVIYLTPLIVYTIAFESILVLDIKPPLASFFFSC